MLLPRVCPFGDNMKYLITLILLISCSIAFERGVYPFPNPVVDPEPPGYNPVEPIYPPKCDCDRIVIVHKDCSQEVHDLKLEIIELKFELALYQKKSSVGLTCLEDLGKLMKAVKKFEDTEEVELKLDGSEFSYSKLIAKEYIKKIPQFVANIRYETGKSPACILMK